MEFIESLTFADYIELAVSIIVAVVLVVRDFRSKKSNKEILSMFRSTSYKDGTVSEGQSFSETKPDYELNRVTNELEKLDTVTNIQELIRSELSSCLEDTLKRMLPDEVSRYIGETSKGVYGESNLLADKLDALSDAMDYACTLGERIRSDLKLPEDLSIDEVYSKAEEYLDNLQKNDKGGAINETQGQTSDAETQQSQTVSSDGKKSA